MQLTTRGSIGNVLKRKAYTRALFCLETVGEAMERLMIAKFLKEANIDINSLFALQQLLQNCYRENFLKAKYDLEICNVFKKYMLFESNVRSGSFGKTATFCSA